MKILTEQLPNFSFDMILVEGTRHTSAGYFNMGDEYGDLWEECRPVHKVSLPDFFIGKYPVTQALWRAVAQAAPKFKLDKNPSAFEGDDRPVEQVSWEDITQKFLPALDELSGKKYRLPTEAEWEYAARGGIYALPTGEGWGGAGYKYAGSDRLKDAGWFDENSGGMTRPVGLKQPNPLGIHDMSGNVWEWCNDRWGGTEYYESCKKAGISDNPPGAESGSIRVYRGGGWGSDAQFCRAANRYYSSPGLRWYAFGFRLALSPQ